MLNIDVVKVFKNHRLTYRFTGQSNRIVVFGPSGSGKTVILKMIAGFFDPDDGRISIDDQLLFSSWDNISMPIFNRNIGYLPQEYTLFPNMPVRENILYGVKTRKIAINDHRFQNLIDRFEIGSKLASYPEDLSGGQQQRVALARALLVRPRILLLDEPFSALDGSIREVLRDLVIDIADEMNIVTLFVTHDLEEAFIFGKEIVLVRNGEVLESGWRDRIFDSPGFTETAALMGFVNIWPIRHLPDKSVQVIGGPQFSYIKDFDKETDTMCIRPENIMFIREDRPYKEKIRKNIIAGRIVRIHHRGKHINIDFKTDDALVMNINMPKHTFDKMKLGLDKPYRVSLKEEAIILCRSKTNGLEPHS